MQVRGNPSNARAGQWAPNTARGRDRHARVGSWAVRLAGEVLEGGAPLSRPPTWLPRCAQPWPALPAAAAMDQLREQLLLPLGCAPPGVLPSPLG